MKWKLLALFGIAAIIAVGLFVGPAALFAEGGFSFADNQNDSKNVSTESDAIPTKIGMATTTTKTIVSYKIKHDSNILVEVELVSIGEEVEFNNK